jgi:elongation factor P
MDQEFNQYEISKDFMEGALKYLEEQMTCEIVFYEGKPLSIELPTKLVREVVYTEPAVKGDTSGKVMKPARLATGHEIFVPAFIEIGEKIEIDTRTDEYVSRAKA